MKRALLLAVFAFLSVLSQKADAQSISVIGGADGVFGGISVDAGSNHCPRGYVCTPHQPHVVNPPIYVQPSVVVPSHVTVHQQNNYFSTQGPTNGGAYSYGLHSDRHNFEIHGFTDHAVSGQTFPLTIRANGLEFFGSLTVHTSAANEWNGAFHVMHGAAVCQGTVQIRRTQGGDVYPSSWSEDRGTTARCIFSQPNLYAGH